MSKDEDIAKRIAKSGWHAIAVAPSAADPGFVYTIGLCSELSHPEIIVCGLPSRHAYELLERLIARIRAGAHYAPDQIVTDLVDNYRFAFRRVDPGQHVIRLGYAMGYYRRLGNPLQLTALQMLWADDNGRLPFEDNCDPAVIAQQPRLDRPYLSKS
jgi:Domain of unknown function (DUF4262)